MYAVIETGGQQHKVSPGDVLKVQKLEYGDAKEVSIEKVLMLATDEKVHIGNPYVAQASVKAEIQGDKRDPKVIVYKQKPRKGYRKLNGHRQNYTILKIKDIVFGG